MNGYSPKDLFFDEQAREKLITGIAKVEKAVGSTLGPRGNTVLMESQSHTHGMTVTKDGVTVAKSISLLDPVENLAVRVLRQASEETANQSGDGTSTSLVLAKAIIDNFLTVIESDKSLNPNFLIRELRSESAKVVASLEKRSIKVTKGRLKNVATISANNDHKIGAIIADAYKKVGKHGVVTPAKSDTNETYIEVTKGIRMDKGFMNRVFANNQSNDECVMEDSASSHLSVLLSTTEITNISHIENVIADTIQNNKQLVMIANVSRNISNVIAQNVHKGVIRAVVERVSQLEEALSRETNQGNKEHIKKRIASLMGGIGVVYAGGDTSMEQKELYDRIDDAIQAVRSSLEEGILPGGGAALYHESVRLSEENGLTSANSDVEQAHRLAARNILINAMIVPMYRIAGNAGIDLAGLSFTDENLRMGYDVVNNKTVDMIKEGIIDPAKVTKSALLNAVSAASTIMTTNAVVTLARSYESS